jgi:hypothetical protein
MALLPATSVANSQLPLFVGLDDGDDEEPVGALGPPGLRDVEEERTVLARLLELARAAAVRESKVAWLKRLLRRVAEPVIVFTEYRDTLERIAAGLDHVDLALLHGGLTVRERREVVSRFCDGTTRLLLATDTGSEGLNLHHRCRLVVSLELPWTPTRLEQRAGRVDRIGQSRPVHAIRLVAAATCEEEIVATLARRVDRIRTAFGARPDQRQVAAAVLGGESLPPAEIERSHPDIRMAGSDLAPAAVQEARRLGSVRAWIQGAAPHRDTRAAIASLRNTSRRGRGSRLWVYSLAFAGESNVPVWNTLLGAAADGVPVSPRNAPALRAALAPFPDLLRAIDAAGSVSREQLAEDLRRTIELWMQRDADILAAIAADHARMSQGLLQRSLFDRRNERTAGARSAVLEEGLASCRARLEDVRAWRTLHIQRCDLVLGVAFE